MVRVQRCEAVVFPKNAALRSEDDDEPQWDHDLELRVNFSPDLERRIEEAIDKFGQRRALADMLLKSGDADDVIERLEQIERAAKKLLRLLRYPGPKGDISNAVTELLVVQLERTYPHRNYNVQPIEWEVADLRDASRDVQEQLRSQTKTSFKKKPDGTADAWILDMMEVFDAAGGRVGVPKDAQGKSPFWKFLLRINNRYLPEQYRFSEGALRARAARLVSKFKKVKGQN